ncbi:hypothetical protein [Pseudomonas sp. 18173]|uniref:hypothetical protein n=1 Tax=Pseudomonas sp. 18173 TaxID=3390055 RepID=UPI003D222CC6
MYTAKTLLFCATLGMGLIGCNVYQDATASTVREECSDLVNKKLIGQNGPEVCITTPLSKSDTSISGTIVGTTATGPFLVTALTSDGVILKQATTGSDRNFTMTQLNLLDLPGKGISFSVYVTGISSPPTKLVIGQEPPSTCSPGTPDYPLCGTYPGAIFFPIKTSITTILKIPSPELYGGASLLPYQMGMNRIYWKADRIINFFTYVPAPAKPGDELTAYATNRNDDSFAYPVKQTVLPGQP